MLKMKKKCEKCQGATLMQASAFICSYECTFCEDCAEKMHKICPNCNGELLLRPKRLKNPAQVVATQIKSPLFN